MAHGDYWDGGTLDPAIATLIQTIIPTKPCGPAIYYSTACEAVAELTAAKSGYIGDCYMTPDKLVAYKNAGGSASYYVSDAAIPALTVAARPSAWVILDGSLSAAETATLTKAAPGAPILTGNATSPKLPVVFPTGLTGTAFYDQTGRLIVTVTNLTSATITGNVTVRPMAGSKWTATYLFANTSKGGSGNALSVTVTRWDTLAIALVRAT